MYFDCPLPRELIQFDKHIFLKWWIQPPTSSGYNPPKKSYHGHHQIVSPSWSVQKSFLPKPMNGWVPPVRFRGWFPAFCFSHFPQTQRAFVARSRHSVSRLRTALDEAEDFAEGLLQAGSHGDNPFHNPFFHFPNVKRKKTWRKIWVFPKIVVPPKHPEMGIFSRKTTTF